MSIESTINAQTRRRLSEHDLAQLIKRNQFDHTLSAQIYNFFVDVPLSGIEQFLADHRIPDSVLKRYYKTYVERVYPRPELEEMLTYAGE